jgi:hypothetical protein
MYLNTGFVVVPAGDCRTMTANSVRKMNMLPIIVTETPVLIAAASENTHPKRHTERQYDYKSLTLGGHNYFLLKKANSRNW